LPPFDAAASDVPAAWRRAGGGARSWVDNEVSQPSQARDNVPRLAAAEATAPTRAAGRPCRDVRDGEAVQCSDARPCALTPRNGRQRRCKAPGRVRRPWPRRPTPARRVRRAPTDALGAHGAAPRARPGPAPAGITQSGSMRLPLCGSPCAAPPVRLPLCGSPCAAPLATPPVRLLLCGSPCAAPLATPPVRLPCAAPPDRDAYLLLRAAAVLGGDARTLFKYGDGLRHRRQPVARKCPDLSGHWFFPNKIRARGIIIASAALSNGKCNVCILSQSSPMLVEARDEQPAFPAPAPESHPSSAATDAFRRRTQPRTRPPSEQHDVAEGLALAATAPR
jgi:hypothetical protein